MKAAIADEASRIAAALEQKRLKKRKRSHEWFLERIQNPGLAGAIFHEELESSEGDEEDEVTNEDEGTKLCELEENEQFVHWKNMAVELLCFNQPDTKRCSICWESATCPPHKFWNRRCKNACTMNRLC